MTRASGCPIRVLCADDHPLVRTGIRAILRSAEEMDVVGEAENGRAVIEMCLAQRPDVLLLDLSMPDLNPYEAVVHLKERVPDLRIIALTAFSSANYVQQMVAAGVDGYIVKDEALETIVRAIKAVMFGAKWFDHDVLKNALNEQIDVPLRQLRVPLTDQEVVILKQLAAGLSDGEIAGSVHIAERTLRNQLRTIYDKLGVNSRVAAAVRATHLGLAPLDASPNTP